MMRRDFQFFSETDNMPPCQMPRCGYTSITGWKLTDRWIWLCPRHNRQYEAGCVLHLPGDRDIIRRRPRAKAMQYA